MNKQDPDSADQSANRDDDAVWLDLVARLEATPSGTGVAVPNPVTPPATSPDAIPGEAVPGEAVPGETIPGDAGPGDALPGRRSLFGDFDPLGLAGAAPVEKSARERQDDNAAAEGLDADEGPRDYDVDDDEGFVPEEPPSLSGAEPLTVLAWLGAVGGPVALLLSAMFWRTAPLTAILGMVAAFVASVVYLIMKLPQDKDENDDGARV